MQAIPLLPKLWMIMTKHAILCVDDEQVILQSLRGQLQHHFGNQFVYEFAESADEALEVIEELSEESVAILVIVSDWLMPNMKGDEFLIRVHERYPNIITVLLTGQADEAAVDRARQFANLHGYIPKPWDESTLVNVIQSGLRGSYE